MGISPKNHFLTNQSRRKPHWSVPGNNKAIVALPKVILYKSQRKKTPLAIEITEIRKEPDFTSSLHPQLPGAQWLSNSWALEPHSFSSHKALASPDLTNSSSEPCCAPGRCKGPLLGFSQWAVQKIYHRDFVISHRSSSVCFLHQQLGWEGKWRETHSTPQRQGKKGCV